MVMCVIIVELGKRFIVISVLCKIDLVEEMELFGVDVLQEIFEVQLVNEFVFLLYQQCWFEDESQIMIVEKFCCIGLIWVEVGCNVINVVKLWC